MCKRNTQITTTGVRSDATETSSSFQLFTCFTFTPRPTNVHSYPFERIEMTSPLTINANLSSPPPRLRRCRSDWPSAAVPGRAPPRAHPSVSCYQDPAAPYGLVVSEDRLRGSCGAAASCCSLVS